MRPCNKARSCAGTATSPRAQSQKLAPSSSHTGRKRSVARIVAEVARRLRVSRSRRGRARLQLRRGSVRPTTLAGNPPSSPRQSPRRRIRWAGTARPHGPESRRCARRLRGRRTATPIRGCTCRAVPGRRSRPSADASGRRARGGWRARSTQLPAVPIVANANEATRAPQLTFASAIWLPCQSERTRRATKTAPARRRSCASVRTLLVVACSAAVAPRR